MAMEVLEKERPDLVVFAWPCTVWSALQNINNKSAEYAEKLQERRRRQMNILRFVLWVCLWCLARQSIFVGENPRTSTAWNTPPLQKLMSNEMIQVIDFAQCAHGLTDPESGLPMRKNTRIVTNCPAMSDLVKPCLHEHHQRIEGTTRVWDTTLHKYITMQRSTYAGGYPRKLCRAILQAVESGSVYSTVYNTTFPVASDHDMNSMMAQQRLQPTPGTYRTWVQETPACTTLQRPHEQAGSPKWYTIVRRKSIDYATGRVLYDHKRDYLQKTRLGPSPFRPCASPHGLLLRPYLHGRRLDSAVHP